MTYGIRYTGPVEGLDLDDRNREIRHLLAENLCEVTFTKVNGEIRTMPCTLRADTVPPLVVKESHEPREFKPETLSVWCTDKGEWRSFRVANVTEVKVLG